MMSYGWEQNGGRTARARKRNLNGEIGATKEDGWIGSFVCVAIIRCCFKTIDFSPFDFFFQSYYYHFVF